MIKCEVCGEETPADPRSWIKKRYCSHRCNQTAYRRRKGQKPNGSYVFRPAEERFWEKVDLTDDCWEWTGATHEKGYGRFNEGGGEEGNLRVVPAHRWAYEHVVGPIPETFVLDHLCANPPCVKPDHLEPVTNRENLLRGGKPHAT